MAINFFKNKSILCPYCLAEIKYAGEITSCDDKRGHGCKEKFPPLYYQNHRVAPPFFIQMIGWSQVGKSTYFYALTQSLQRMDRFWGSSNFTIMPETDETMEYMREVENMRSCDSIPSVTKRTDKQQAYIMELKNMPRWGNRTVVTRDVPGEIFDPLFFEEKFIPYFMHVPTTIMLFSPSDTEGQPKHQMSFLMSGFINTLAKNRYDPSRQQKHVVVVIAKADKLLTGNSGGQELPESLKEYLRNDPFDFQHSPVPIDNTYMDKYMSELKQLGSTIQEYVMNQVPFGRQFVIQANQNGIKLDFCLISSLGGDPGQNNQMQIVQRPLRVMDPLLLALDYQSS